MHSLVRRFLKTAIIFLVIGLLLGLWMMVERELGGHVSGPYAVSAHTHAILVGFVMMMILGVALWLFPRPSKDDARYTPCPLRRTRLLARHGGNGGAGDR
jgi:membrane associated rhomboid family serine protease